MTTSLCVAYEKLKEVSSSKVCFSEPLKLKNLFHYFIASKKRDVEILLNTKPPEGRDATYQLQTQEFLNLLQSAGVEVFFMVKHYRKLAIIDRQIIYEGSLNILSYRDSCEIMRRTTFAFEAEMLIDFIGLSKFMEVK